MNFTNLRWWKKEKLIDPMYHFKKFFGPISSQNLILSWTDKIMIVIAGSLHLQGSWEWEKGLRYGFPYLRWSSPFHMPVSSVLLQHINVMFEPYCALFFFRYCFTLFHLLPFCSGISENDILYGRKRLRER